ncbi:MAG: hypothetical protein GKS00_05655 [Alphaproteobacteria bacterium]|nr:hypothetical protein [Alphaproteobacteria bacterium]
MVQTKKMKLLENRLEIIRNQTLPIFDYENDRDIFDAICQIFTDESGFAGIAYRLVDNPSATISDEERKAVIDPVFSTPGKLLGRSGEEIDLRSAPEVVKYAENMDELRKAIIEVSKDKET